MKKIFFVLTMLLFSGLVFAENSLKDYIAEFLNKGSYIFLDNGSRSLFIPKRMIANLRYDSEDFSFTYIKDGSEYTEHFVDIEDCLINIDKNSNIIISEKQK